MTGDFNSVGAEGLLGAWEERVNDVRPRVSTGWKQLDDCLHRGGFSPGELVILGGRTHTRKTTVAINMMVEMLAEGVTVGFVALDETTHGYAAKLGSVVTGRPHQQLEEEWKKGAGTWRPAMKEALAHLSVTRGARPTPQTLHRWLTDTALEDTGGRTPQVVFIDYISLMSRDKYSGAEVQRVQRLIEELQVWTNEHDVVTIALHQVGRMDEGQGKRYHGDTPLSLESLKFGGEEIADIVLGTYRPENNQVGQMEQSEAKAMLGDKFDEESYGEARDRVVSNRGITYLQLLKNRPGVHLDYQGMRLKSRTEALTMEPVLQSVPDQKKVLLDA